jgi:hypothetical protein
MAKTQEQFHNGKTIYYMDFSDIKSMGEINGVINEAVAYIRQQPPMSVLTLTNISNMHFNNEIKDLFQDFIKGNKPFVKAGAVVGLSSLQQILYNSLMKITGRNIKSISTIPAAKDWLTMQD